MALSVCATTLAGGCADSGDGSGQEPVPRSVRAQDDLLKRAESALARRCLTDRRITAPADGGAGQGRGLAPRREFPYGIDDPGWAARHGFGIPVERGSREQEVGVSKEQQRLSDVLFGTGRRELSTRTATGLVVQANSDGCLAEAQRVLYGDLGRWFRTGVTVNNLAAAAHRRVTQDPVYRAALARWSRCVAPVQPADSPGELRGAWQRRARGLAPREATALQQRLAVTEARCVRRTDLARTGARLEERYAAELRAEYADVIAEHRQLRDHGLRYAMRHGL